MTDRWLVSICAGWQQKHSLMVAKSMGLRVIAFDGNANAPCSEIVDLFFNIDVNNSNSIIKKIEELDILIFCAVSFISDAGLITAGKVNDYFKTNQISEKTAILFTDKSLQREIWESNRTLNSPKWELFESGQKRDLQELFKEFSTAVMIKPVDSAGSKGISKLNYPYKTKEEAINHALEFSKSKKVIVEEFIHGIELSVECFWSNGKCQILAISERTIENDRTASMIKTIDLDSNIENVIFDAVREANIALGINSGPTHTELILDHQNRPFILETAARGGGFLVFDFLAQKRSGLDCTHKHINQLIGYDNQLLEFENSLSCHALIKFLTSREGVIKKVSGFNRVNKFKNVYAHSFVKKGDKTLSNISDGDRLGYVLIQGTSQSKINNILNDVLLEINFEYEEDYK